VLNKLIHSVTTIAIVILSIMLVIKTKQFNVEQDKNLSSAGSIESLKKELKFNSDTVAALKIENGRLIILTKDKNGNVVPQHPYVPPEGGVRVRVDGPVVSGTTTGQPRVVIDIKNKGFTFKPGIGMVYSSKIYPEFDIKFAYWNRYSVKVGTTLDFVDAAITRHVDDLIPWVNLQNLEIQLGGGINYIDAIRRIMFGIRING